MKNKMILKLVLNIFCFELINCNDIQIHTTVGIVEGLKLNVLNRTVDQFLGIPYAEPPVGSLRFAKPKPISKPIEGIIDATKAKNSCIQPSGEWVAEFMGNLTYNEDCLFLNIWSTNVLNQSNLHPVMFWIHGGGLEIGSSFQSQYHGRALATHDVVVVSTNYRLGNLGFMYAGDESVPGNMGFYDQLLALKWTRENIHLFGGDKNQITIFGESAGSWSVSVQLLSPLSKGMFNRAIMQSGADFYNKDRPMVSKEEAINTAKQTAKHMNCTDDKQWLQCLRRVDAKELVIGNKGLSFAVEGTEYMPFSPQKAFSDLKFNKDLDLMAGVTRNEGTTLASMSFPNIFNKTTQTEEDFKEFIDKISLMFHNLNSTQIIEYYLKGVDKNNSDAIKWKIYDFYGDVFLKCPTYHFARQYAERSSNKTNVFFYELTHSSKGAAYEHEFGVYHGADIDFVFGLPLLKPKDYSKEDNDFSKEVMKYWTDFAKYGKPDSWKWQKLIDSEEQDHVTITKELNPRNNSSYFADLFKSNCDGFWKNYYLDDKTK